MENIADTYRRHIKHYVKIENIVKIYTGRVGHCVITENMVEDG